MRSVQDHMLRIMVVLQRRVHVRLASLHALPVEGRGPGALCGSRPPTLSQSAQAKEKEAERKRRESGGMPYSLPYSPGRASISARRVSLSDTPLGGARSVAVSGMLG